MSGRTPRPCTIADWPNGPPISEAWLPPYDERWLRRLRRPGASTICRKRPTLFWAWRFGGTWRCRPRTALCDPASGRDQIRAPGESQLGGQVAPVPLDRSHAQVEALGDFPVGQAVSDQLQDLPLPVGENSDEIVREVR